jgi:hypothetical protein
MVKRMWRESSILESAIRIRLRQCSALGVTGGAASTGSAAPDSPVNVIRQVKAAVVARYLWILIFKLL